MAATSEKAINDFAHLNIGPFPTAGIRMIVLGTPVPQGSKVGFVRRNGTAGTRDHNAGKLNSWRAEVSAKAQDMARLYGTLDGPLRIEVQFRFRMPQSRPKGVRIAGYGLHTVKPDGDKLIRGVCDALTAGGLIRDDARISTGMWTKREVYDGWTGADIWLSRDRIEGLETLT